MGRVGYWRAGGWDLVTLYVDSAMPMQVLRFIAERMALRHPNLLTVLGVSAEPITEDPLLVQYCCFFCFLMVDSISVFYAALVVVAFWLLHSVVGLQHGDGV